MSRTRSSLTIVRQLREEIFAGLRPGDRLGTENELAGRFDVSRITMRDAVRTLEAEGFIEVAVGVRGGLRVAAGDPARAAESLSAQLYLQDLSWTELVEAMQVLETETARLAAGRATEQDVATLREIIEDTQDRAAGPFTSRSLDFHLEIARIAGNRALTASVQALRGAQRRLFAAETTSRSRDSVIEMHRRIVDAIASHDEAAVTIAMNEHLDRMRRATR